VDPIIDPSVYEKLVSKAHAFETGGKAERYNHEKANADLFKPKRLEEVRQGIEYAAEVLIDGAKENYDLEDEEIEQMENINQKIESVGNLDELTKYMNDLQDSVLHKYYNYDGDSKRVSLNRGST